MTSCSAEKVTTKSNDPTPDEIRTEQILKEGDIKATIEEKTKSGCEFVIKNIATGEFLLPINLEDDYKKAGLNVWLKYRPIRPVQGVCIIGNPITIEEIKIIE